MVSVKETTISASNLPVITKDAIKKKIQEGYLLIIFEEKVFDVTKWAFHHPGGFLAIKHMVGRDATSQMKVFHPPYVIEQKMQRFCIGRMALEHEEASIAAEEVERKSKIQARFNQLKEEIIAEGLDKTNFSYYLKVYFRLSLLFVLVWFMVLEDAANLWFPASLLLALFWHQAAFVGHDTGHTAITGDLATDHSLGVTVGNIFGGISMGWWKDSHYVHHIVTNDPEHDPDIQHLPFFAVSETFFKSIYSTYHERKMKFDAFAKLFISIQHYMYYFILMFGRFNLYVQSFIYVTVRQRVRQRTLEFVGLIAFWIWYLTLMSYLPTLRVQLAFFLISNAMTFFLHVQITLSHFAMSTDSVVGIGGDQDPDHKHSNGAIEDEEFILQQLRTTMDIDCPRYMDWFHGGLQFQAIHHLFPRVPRHNLRRVRTKVIAMCREMNIPYYCVGFIEANLMVLRSLKRVAISSRDLLP